jgi:hypothetical protein
MGRGVSGRFLRPGTPSDTDPFDDGLGRFNRHQLGTGNLGRDRADHPLGLGRVERRPV